MCGERVGQAAAVGVGERQPRCGLCCTGPGGATLLFFFVTWLQASTALPHSTTPHLSSTQRQPRWVGSTGSATLPRRTSVSRSGSCKQRMGESVRVCFRPDVQCAAARCHQSIPKGGVRQPGRGEGGGCDAHHGLC